ncbi:DUF998 domain-containing protein [Amycolatopsis sp. NBC_01488]|uniref:DUF998 domain-containing protein n=1 Tax=Amycolatopsis sp. NBC_01488 TaxID=2903563 RepID=UPI002E2E177B|nr:DUF998 domain-containing protein [Amycolatopsis sp. NBC_01488]
MPGAAGVLVPVAVGAFVTAAVLLVVLHVDRRWGPIDPVTAMLSDYAWCPGWWMWDAALILTAAGSVAVGAVLHRHRVLPGPLAAAMMAVWCVSVLAVAAFTKDPQGGAVSVTGKVHLYATGISCVSLPLVGWLLGRRHRRDLRWYRYAGWSRGLALAAIPFFLPFIVPFVVNVLLGGHLPTVATGLVERLMIVLELALLVVLDCEQVAAADTGVSVRAVAACAGSATRPETVTAVVMDRHRRRRGRVVGRPLVAGMSAGRLWLP